MKHLFKLADIESALVRRLMLLIHLPVIAFAFVMHLIEGVLRGVHNFINGIIVSVSHTVQDFAQHIVTGVNTIGRDISKVWRGNVLAQAPQAPTDELMPVVAVGPAAVATPTQG